jgi:hypothetical protein
MPGIEKEALAVVDKYLESSAAGNWNDVFEALSGEALAQARANSGRVKTAEKVISKSLKAKPVCRDITEVSADFTKASSIGFDRLAYDFLLIKSGSGWAIYKTKSGSYHHGELKSGQVPPEAAGAIKMYLELPMLEKRAGAHRYLAGKLLQDSRKAGLLPEEWQVERAQEKVTARVRSMDCLGIADGYGVALVNLDITRDSSTCPVEILVNFIDVNGTWKICQMDITRL